MKILGTQKVTVNHQNAFLLDLLSHDRKRQIRQILFKKKKKVVLLTCRDRREFFLETVKDCNKIIRSFKWFPDSVGVNKN
ncbi:MAG: hypothetical protein D6797_02360 [Bdellovibrio sp.]|nr:MAG: hypothetical protein D6797_02360 [Bdellovibrio sp.]